MKNVAKEYAWVDDPWHDDTPSNNGAQLEDQLIRDFLPGWGREVSEEMKLAFFPHCTLQRERVGEDGIKRVEVYSSLAREGNGRGRGISWIDAGTAVHGRSGGGSLISLKTKTARKQGDKFTYASDVDLCRGSLSRPTLGGGLESLRQMAPHMGRQGKPFPLVVVRYLGDKPVVYAIVDLPRLIAGAPASTTLNGWSGESLYGLPLKNEGVVHPRRGGHPVPVWIERDERDGREYYTAKASTRAFQWVEWNAVVFTAAVEKAAQGW